MSLTAKSCAEVTTAEIAKKYNRCNYDRKLLYLSLHAHELKSQVYQCTNSVSFTKLLDFSKLQLNKGKEEK